MRRLLMISPHFPPDTSAGTHRVRLLAPRMKAHGWDPVVLTIDPRDYEGRLDHELASLVPNDLAVVRCRAWPTQVTRAAGIGDLGLRSWVSLRDAATRLLGQQQFDAVFITIYPSYPAVLGPWLKRQYDIPFILDLQDPWVSAWGKTTGPDGSPDLKSRVSRLLSEPLEAFTVRRADALTSVSARTIADALDRAGVSECPSAEIPIGWDERDLDAVRRRSWHNPWFTPGDGLAHLCYVGTVLPLGIDTLRALLAGARLLRDTRPEVYARLRLHFIGTSNQANDSAPPRVLPIASELGVEACVDEVPGRVGYLDALNVQLDATALLLVGSSEPHYTPSKVFPALLAARPIVAAYHDASSAHDIIERGLPPASRRLLTNTVPADALAAAMRDALADVVEGRLVVPSAVNRDAIAPWSAARGAGRLATLLDQVAA